MLTFVICVFNAVKFTRMCLDSLQRHVLRDGMEVIVADDASTDETPQVIPAAYPWVRYLRHDVNRGYGPTCTWAGLQAKGDRLLLLNNDTEATDDFLAPLLARLESAPRIGMVAARLLYEDGTLQHGGVAYNQDKIPYHRYRYFKGDFRAAMQPRSMLSVTGACIVMPRPAFEAVNGFAPGYRNGMEDVDQCLRLRALGYDVWYEPRASMFHYESKSPNRHAKNDSNQALFLGHWKDSVVPDEERLYDEDHFPKPLQKHVDKFANAETAEPFLPLVWETTDADRAAVEALAAESEEYYALPLTIRAGTETAGIVRDRHPAMRKRLPLRPAATGLTQLQTALAEALQQTTPDSLLVEGRQALRQGQDMSAYVESFVSLFPHLHEPQLLQGDWLWKQGQAAAALASYQRAAEVVTPAYMARRMAQVLLQQGRTDEARTQVSALLHQNPYDLQARWLQIKVRSLPG
ncbi:MAG TPA: glycosyltransferase [Candidatus Xenobia bacterium]|jgi:GT2 family glycosyltransferase